MAVQSFPVLLWRHADDAVGGTLVGDYRNAAARGADEREVLRQFGDLLAWRAKHEPWSVDPELREPRLLEIKVEVRAQYQDAARHRLIPAPDTTVIRVPCVIGKAENGMPVCEIPSLEIRFHFQNEHQIRELAGHFVKEALSNKTPAELACLLPPRGAWLGQVAVREPQAGSRRPPVSEREEFKTLFAVGDPLLHGRGTQSAAYGRDEEVMSLMGKLASERAHVLLVGEPGCGKSTVLMDAARRMARLDAGEDGDRSLRSWRCWRVSGARFIAGMKYLGQWEQRCEEFIRRLGDIEGVCCAENLLELLRVGGSTPNDSVAAFLLPYLQRRDLIMVAEATPAELDACRRLMPALPDVFQILRVPPFDDTESRAVLESVVRTCSSTDRLDFEPGVVAVIHRLFRRFRPHAAFPGPACAFVKKLADDAARRPPAEREVTAAHALALFIRQTGLPEHLLRDDIPLAPEMIRETLATRVIGQTRAVDAAARAITAIKAGMTDPARPQAVLLFCGPTGVGKTALAGAMADFCFGAGADAERLVRLDMSEYGGWDAASRLLHAPDGEPAAWIRKIRRQPFAVVLLDEIEKAAPAAFDVLLGLLDEGRLTDRFGRVTDFRSAVILVTSNLGVSATGPIGFGADHAAPPFEDAVGKFFRPEFFNRLDAVVAFDPLGPAEVRLIALKELADLATREGLAAAGLRLAWSDAIVAALVRDGYDPLHGARPLQRALDRLIVTPLAQWRLAHPHTTDTTLDLDLTPAGTLEIGDRG